MYVQMAVVLETFRPSMKVWDLQIVGAGFSTRESICRYSIVMLKLASCSS